MAPLTRRLFERAGITAGMRVLDMAQDRAMSRCWPPNWWGQRVMSPVLTAIPPKSSTPSNARRRRPRKRSLCGGQFREIELTPAVDAIVRQLVLMYAADPLDAIRRAVRNLKSGGIIALQKSIIDYEGPVFIQPLDCLAARAAEWFRAGFKRAGVHSRMGMRLFGLMRKAVLIPSIEIDMLVPIQQGPDGALFGTLASVVRSQIPAIVASGAATEAEIQIDTLEERMIADAPG